MTRRQKTVHGFRKLAQVPLPQAIPVDGFHDGHQQVPHLHDERFQLGVERPTPKIIVEISNEMDQAFLLPTRDRIVAAVEVGDEDTAVLA